MAFEVSPSLTHVPDATASYYFGPLITEREMGILEWDDFLSFGDRDRRFSGKLCLHLCVGEIKRRCSNIHIGWEKSKRKIGR